MSRRLARGLEGTRLLVEAVKHHGCNGTGIGSRIGMRCRACGGTGEAGLAFGSYLRKIGLEDSSLDLEPDFDHAIDCYVTSIYGEKDTLRHEEESKRAPYVYTVLQNVVDKAAGSTVRRLGTTANLFNWLRMQEREHCPKGAEETWTP